MSRVNGWTTVGGLCIFVPLLIAIGLVGESVTTWFAKWPISWRTLTMWSVGLGYLSLVVLWQWLRVAKRLRRRRRP